MDDVLPLLEVRRKEGDVLGNVRLGGARHGTGSDLFIKGIEGDGNAEVFKVFLFVQEEVMP